MATEPSSQIVRQATPARLLDLDGWVGAPAAEFSLLPPLLERIDLCLTELVTNAIDCGYSNGAPVLCAGAGIAAALTPEAVARFVLSRYSSVKDWLPLVWAVPPLSVAPAGM
jgi:hypothetical protein